MQTGSYSKFIVAISGIIATYIDQYYATAHWASIAIAAMTAVVVFLVPNQGSTNVTGILPDTEYTNTAKPKAEG
jgi:hypothetical protein